MDITPRTAQVLASNGFPHQPTARVAERLEANILVIHEPSPIVVATLDLLYAGAAIRNGLRTRFPLLESSRLMVAASHTHRAPAVDGSKPRLGTVDPEYLDFVCTAVGDAVSSLLEQGPKDIVTVRSHAGTTGLAVNRRRRRFLRVGGDGVLLRKWSYGPRPSGPTDATLHRADLVTTDGRVVCTLWRFGCHPSSAPDSLAISPDFIGRVRRHLRERRGDHPVLFFQGFSGDVRCPSVTSSREMPLATLRLGTHFRNFTVEEYRAWTGALAREVLTLPEREPSRWHIAAGRIEYPQDRFVLGGSGSPAAFHYLHLGPLALVGVSAEVVADYADRLNALGADAGLDSNHLWPVSCLEDVFGYAPTAQILREGGYEGKGFVHALSLAGVNPDIETAMLNGFQTALGGLRQAQAVPR